MLPLHCGASIHQSQMEVCKKKVGPELTAPNFTLNLIQFVTFTTGDLEKPKTQKQLRLSYTSLLIVFRWTETFYFTNKQECLNENVEFNCVRCVNVFFCCCQQRKIDFIILTAAVYVSMGGRGWGECCCTTIEPSLHFSEPENYTQF